MAQDIRVALTLDNKQFNQAIDQSEKKTKKFSKSSKSGLSGLTKAFAGLAAAVGIGEIVKLGDEFTNINNRLKAVTGSTEAAASAFKLVDQVSAESRSSLSATASLFADLTIATKDLGTSQAEIADITRVFGQTLAISGADAGAASGAIRQFGQALASGVLRGDEFNSIAETNSAFMLKLAEALGQPIGALRDLAKQGALTADVVLAATRKMKDSVQADFDLTIGTVSQSFTALRNSVVKLFGSIEGETGVFEGLSQAILDMAKALTKVDIKGLIEALKTFGTVLVVVAGALTILSAGLFNSAGLFVALETAIAGGIAALLTLKTILPLIALNFGTLGYALTAVGHALMNVGAAVTLFRIGITAALLPALATLGTALLALAAAATPVLLVLGGIALVIEGVGRLLMPGKSPFVRMYQQMKELVTGTKEATEATDELNQANKDAEAIAKAKAEADAKAKKAADEKIRLEQTYAGFLETLNKNIVKNTRNEKFRLQAVAELTEAYNSNLLGINEYTQAMKLLSESLIDVDERTKGATDAVNEFNDAVIAGTADLDKELAQLNMSEFQKSQDDIKRDLELLRDETIRDLKDELKGLSPSLDKEAFDEITQQIKDVTAATEIAIVKQVELGEKGYNASRTFASGWKESLTTFVEDSTNAADKAKEAFSTFSTGVEDAFVSFAKTGKLSFKALLDDMVEMLLRSQIQKLMASLLSTTAGGKIATFFSTLFGKKHGGPVSAGTPYLVGEGGMEIFTPSTNGHITPNNQIGSGGGSATTNNYITNNINALDSRSVAQVFAENRQTLLGTVEYARKETSYGV